MTDTLKDIVHFSITDPADQLRMDAYHATFSEAGHLWLAMHAAFPIALTTDLLYKIWMNFIPYPEDMNDTPYGQLSEKILTKHLSPTDSPIGINAVGDLLLSPLCREIGYDVYEFYPHLREALWKSLPLKRQQQLADFLQRYLEFCPDKVPSKAFAESQRVWSQITLGQFDQVNALLSELYAAPNTGHAASKRDFILSLIAQKTNATHPANENAPASIPTSDLERLTQGISAYKQGNHEEAHNHLGSVRQHLSTEKTIKGFNVPIPKNLWESLPVNAPVEPPKEGKIYALLVGIDAYGAGMENKKFSGCINDVHAWQTLLKAHDTTVEIVSLLDAQATKEAIVQALRNAMSTFSPDDTLLFAFSGHAHNKDLPHSLAAYDSIADQRETYLSETEFKSIISSLYAYNPFVVVILDTHAGSAGWIDTNNEKQVLLAATATGEISMEVDKKGLFTTALQATFEGNKQAVSYRKLIREAYRFIKDKKHKQIPQLFGHPKAINQAFLGGSASPNTYINELLQQSDYQNFEQILEDFGIENQEERFIDVLQKYALLKGTEKLKVVRISSEMSVQQISVFQREYLKSLPYEVEIKDMSLFYAPSRGGLKDALLYEEEMEDDLSALQDPHIIVFVLNRALVNDFTRHTAIAPVVNHLKRFEYKVVCSILWEDCDWQRTVLKDYHVFSKNEPLERSLSGFKTELEIKRHYEHDWQPVVNKWIQDLTLLNILSENTEDLQKEFERRLSRMRVTNPQHSKNDDPQKDLWGGKSENKGFKINVTVEPESDSDRYFSIYISLQQTENSNLSASKVAFFLHNTFSPMIMVVPFVENKAELSLKSYEAFTFGAMTDTGVELEIDLNQLTGFPSEFYYSNYNFGTIFLAYANSKINSLTSLIEEYEEVQKVLQEGVVKGDFMVVSEPFATTSSIINIIQTYEKKIGLFVFSGYAGRDSLIDNNIEIATILGRCPNLKLVILNGCATVEQLKMLFKNGIPIVIATSSTVGEIAATEFLIAFFSELFTQGRASIRKAFQIAIKKTKAFIKIDTKVHSAKGLELYSEKKPLWGLYYNDSQLYEQGFTKSPSDNYKTIKSEMHNLLSEGKNGEAIEKALNIKTLNIDKKNDFILLHAQLRNLEKEESLGIISFDESRLVRSRIVYNILHLIDQLDKQ